MHAAEPGGKRCVQHLEDAFLIEHRVPVATNSVHKKWDIPRKHDLNISKEAMWRVGVNSC